MAAQAPIPDHLALARSFLAAGRNLEAIDEFQKALDANEIGARNADAWSDWGAALYNAAKFEEALEKHRKALEIDSKHVNAYANIGVVFAALRQFDKAIENYSAAVKIDPNHKSAYFNWGNSLYKQGQFDQAIEKYRKAVEINPESGDAWLWQIKSLRRLGRFRDAESTAREATQKLPDNAGILQELAEVYVAESAHQKALETLDKAIALEPHNRQLVESKLTGLKQAWGPALVEKTVKEALAAFPNDAGMSIAVGQLYKGQAEYLKAKAAFDTAWRINEADADSETKARRSLEILLGRGSLYSDWHKVDEAMEQFDLAMQRDPNSATTLWWKVFLLRQRRRLDDADALLSRELTHGAPRSKDVSLLNQRGSLCLDRTQYEDAIQAFRQTLQVQSGNEEALEGILCAHRLRRDFHGATRVWNDEILTRIVPVSAALFKERCNFFLDQLRYADGVEFCRQRPDTDLDAIRTRIFFLRCQLLLKNAEAEAQSALARFPGNTDFLTELGMIYFLSRQYRKAAGCFRQILDSHPMNEFALEWRANSLRAQGPECYEAAERELFAAIDLIPESPTLHFSMGQLNNDRDQLTKTEEYLSKAVAFAPPDYRAPDILRITVLEGLSRGEQARQLVDALEKARPNDLEVLTATGWFHLRRNDTYPAQKRFEAVMAIDPNHINGINGSAAVYFTQGDFEEAKERFRRALLAAPNDPVLLTNLAWAEVRSEDDDAKAQPEKKPNGKERVAGYQKDNGYSDAERLCRQALAIDPNQAQSHTCLGVIAFKRGRVLESEDHLRASIRANSKEGGYVDLGALYVFIGKYEEAEANLKKGVEVGRADSRARIELGNLYLLTNREKEGIRLFREAVAIDPFNPEPPRALALALQRKGDFREAAQVLRTAIQSLDERRRWQLHLTLAQLLTEQGDTAEETALYDDALKHIKFAIALKSKSAEVWFRAGIIWHRLENYRKALKSFQQCLKLDEDHIEAERNLRTVRKLIREESRRARSVFWLGIVLGTFCLGGTVGMWLLYFFATKGMITPGMVTGLTPTLIAIAAGAFLFPYVIRLKLPGVEAELSQPTEKISKGPTGQIGSQK
jgi:tetratricopeptide (TPR) repeat protein